MTILWDRAKRGVDFRRGGAGRHGVQSGQNRLVRDVSSALARELVAAKAGVRHWILVRQLRR
jgi:hypothetical protein